MAAAQPTDRWCETKSEVGKVRFTWTINNFSRRRENVGDYLESSVFSAENFPHFEWSLKAYPRGSDEDSKDFFSLYLELVDNDTETEISTTYKLTILNSRGDNRVSEGNDMFSPGESWGYVKLIERSVLLDSERGFLQNDKLTIRCEITFVDDSVNVSGRNVAARVNNLGLINPAAHGVNVGRVANNPVAPGVARIPSTSGIANATRVVTPGKVSAPVADTLKKNGKRDEPDRRLSEDFGKLMETQRFSDVTLKVKGKEFHVHKVILAARSQVFAAMFEHEMSEKKKNLVEISDIEQDVLRELLYFIYTGKTSGLKKAEGLLEAADKYAVDGLKEICEEALGSNLAIAKACNTLVLADLHNSYKLKARAIDFVVSHAPKVARTKSWETMLLKYPNLVTEVFKVSASRLPAPVGPPRKRKKM